MALDLDKIRAAAERVATSYGFEVVEVEYSGGARHGVLRVFIEKNAAERAKLAEAARSGNGKPTAGEWKPPEDVPLDQLAGITVDDCQTFSGDFGTFLDVEDLVPGVEYTLEVSSPGLDRRLRNKQDFERFAGNRVKLRTFEPVDGNRYWQGRIGSVDGETLVLEVGSPGKGRKRPTAAAAANKVRIAFSNILKANLEPDI